MMDKPLDIFHPLVAEWFRSAYREPTEVQRLAWPVISRGGHVLVSAPTGTGKTLTAFLWALNRLITGEWEPGAVRVLYVSPLKALNNDIRRNLRDPLEGIRGVFRNAGRPVPEIGIMTRSGDTPQDERRRMVRRPPEILITTPESLNLILSSPKARGILTGVRSVILDEIHALAESKRGTHLMTAVERLVLLAGEFQRIAVSATIRPLPLIADFVGGYTPGRRERRAVTIVNSGAEKVIDLSVEYTGIAGAEPGAEDPDDTVWKNIAREIRARIRGERSTLVFVNSRRLAERITQHINEDGELLAYAHHGSLSREIRTVVERRLKDGELSAIVATSSLEMGIDIGDLKQVILVETPFSVSSAVQRIGRAGHSVGEASRGVLFAGHGRDVVQAAVMTRLVREKDIEAVRPVESPYDVLAQVLLSMTGVEEWNLDRLFDAVICSWPFRNLTRAQFDRVVDMLAGKYRRTRIRELKPKVSVDAVEGTVRARDGVLWSVYAAGGTIPDRGYFALKVSGTQAVLGELDEEFVWERKLGDTFTLGAQSWKITAIDHQKVEVIPYTGPLMIAPFWRAEGVNRSYHLSERLGVFMEEYEELSKRPGFKAGIATACGLSEKAASKLTEFLDGQREHTGKALPHRRHVVAEHTVLPESGPDLEHLFIHTLWGNRVNYPLSLCLQAILHRDGILADIRSDNDSILLSVPADEDAPPIDAASLLSRIAPDAVEELLMEKLEGSGFFGARFRENAGRALLLPRAGIRKRTPLWLNRLRAKKLLEAVSGFDDFPITVETWRTCIRDEFDLEALTGLLGEIRSGRIVVSECRTRSPSPLAAGVIYQNTNELMYSDDVPLGGGRAAKSTASGLLRELVFSPHLRPKIPRALVDELQAKLQRTAPGYPPSTVRELVDWVEERIVIPGGEWRALEAAAVSEYGDEARTAFSECGSRVVRIEPAGSLTHSFASMANLASLTAALSCTLEDLGVRTLTGGEVGDVLARDIGKAMSRRTSSDDEPYLIEDLAAGILSFYGPVKPAFLSEVLGTSRSLPDPVLDSLAENGSVVVDRISEGAEEIEICDAANLERLLSMLRRAAERPFTALPAEALTPFLAGWQGLGLRGETEEDLEAAVETLMGWPARAETWEGELFTARIAGYRRSWLDDLVRRGALGFFGCGKERVSFCWEGEEELFLERGRSDRPSPLLPAAIGTYDFREIKDHTGLSSAELEKELWEGFWSGEIVSDTFETLREGIRTGFTAAGTALPAEEGGSRTFGTRPSGRTGYSRRRPVKPMTGKWGALRIPDRDLDEVDSEEMNKERVRQLLQRYGVLFRDILGRETPPFRWNRLFRTLRIMELGGEVLAGRFFEGIRGIQFTSPAAFRLLKDGIDATAVYWMNAADPASLCGIADPSLRKGFPDRLKTTWLVFRGSAIVLIARRNGRDLEFTVPPDDPGIPEYLGFFKVLLSRDAEPFTSIKVLTVNRAPAEECRYARALEDFGFRKEYKGYSLWAR